MATASGSLLIAGDFNLRVNDVRDTTATRFLQLIESFNLKQHVCEPTHRNGHILDLLITRADESIASAVNVTDPSLSDHLAVRCCLSLPKTAFERKEIQYRKLKSVDISLFRSDLSNAFLKTSICHDTDVSLPVQEYNSILTGLLDKHAPVKKRVLTLRPNAAWYTDDIKQEKAKRRKLERRWRATRLTIDRQIYVEQCKHVSKCIYDAKREYYSSVIAENQSDPKRLFSTVNKLLHRHDDDCPPTSDKSSLVSAFADYFTDKILSIKLGLCRLKSDRGIENTVSDLSCGSSLTEFNPVSPDKSR